MELDEVAGGVFWVEASHTNLVLVVDGSDVTMVDSGYPKDRGLVDVSVAEIGRSLADVQAMVLTHGHVDHKGSAERLRLDHDVTVHCHGSEVRLARGEIKQQISTWELRRAWRPTIFRFAVNAIRHGGLRPEHVTAVSTFADGEVLDVPGNPIAVFTPGHTEGHCGFYLPEKGVLISGDALVTVDLWDPERRGPQMIRRQFSYNHDQAIRSLDRFVDLDADVVVPGHGEPWRGEPREAVAMARRNA
ncbi:MAG: MBL fold metallo-hydrolase [Acidimicrobiia bacterium]|nr:MBL fold metallo-hydrolase [Acidimicrobiia bacterium]